MSDYGTGNRRYDWLSFAWINLWRDWIAERWWRMICRKCGGDFIVNGLHDGLCMKCLRDEYDQLLEAAFLETATLCEETEFVNDESSKNSLHGWYDSNGRSTACDYGDRLVALGLWERHPCGVGRRQWYRPVKKEGG